MSRPRLARDVNYLPGLISVALFVVFAVAFLNAPLRDPQTFGGDAALTRSIGAALMNIDPSAVTADGAAVAGESFLVAFILIAVVLDAALDGSLMLAKRDSTPDALPDGGTTDPGEAGASAEAEVDGASADESASTDGTPTDAAAADEGGDSAW